MTAEVQTVLIEREHEGEVLGASLRAAADGRGSFVLVEAAAGLGKTSLLAAAARQAEELGLRVLAARATELDRSLAFGVVRQLLDPVLRSAPAALRRDLLRGSAAACEPLLTGQAPAAAVRSPELLHALYWLVAGLAEHGSLAILIDDAQWADRRSQDLLAFLAPRIGELPVAMVVAARPSGDASGVAERLASAPEVELLRPAPLSVEGCAALAGAELGRVEASFASACHEATHGNPFYLRELVHALAADAVAPSAEAVRTLGPGTIARAVLSRVFPLSPEAVRLVRVLAVLNDGIELRHAAALAGLTPEEAAAAAAALVRAQVIADERALAFVHPIVRAAIQADLTVAERTALNAAAARRLAAEPGGAERALPYLLETEPAGDPDVVAALREGARAGAARAGGEIAVRCLRRALEEPPEPGERAAVLRELGAAEHDVGDPAALARLQEAMAAAGDPRERALTALPYGRSLMAAARVADAVAVLDEAAAALEDDDELVSELRAELSGAALLDHGAAREALDRMEEVAEAPAPAGRASAAHRATLGNLSWWLALQGADARRAGELAERAVADGVLLRAAGTSAPTLHYAANVLVAADRFDAAAEVLDAALDEARRSGSAIGFAVTATTRSLLAFRLGRLEDAEAEARAAVDTARLHGWLEGLPMAPAFLVDALIELGRLDDAVAELAAGGLEGELPDGALVLPALAARGRLRIALGDPEAGVADLLEVGARAERAGVLSTAGPPTFRAYAAPALAGLGDRDTARRLAAEEVATGRAWGAPRGLGVALRVEGTVLDGEQAVARLREAVEILAATPARLEHARAQADLGAALRRSGEPAEARTPLTEALAVAQELGAVPLVERIEYELGATGARRKRADRYTLSGPDALTPSERRVAQMAVDGLTNREIAQALFLTRKTIEMHLHNAYGKLGIASRAELPAALSGDS